MLTRLSGKHRVLVSTLIQRDKDKDKDKEDKEESGLFARDMRVLGPVLCSLKKAGLISRGPRKPTTTTASNSSSSGHG